MMAMRRFKVSRLTVKEDNQEITLERESEDQVLCEFPLDTASSSNANLLGQWERPTAAAALPSMPEKPHSELGDKSQYVTSPMVGTYYSAPSPDSSPFVKVGQKVEPDTVVCIVEAMKVLNEVKAGVAGTVSELLVENGHPVEFGSKIIRVS